MSKNESAKDGMIVFAGWAVTYKDKPAKKWDRKKRQEVREDVDPETFFKEIDSTPKVFRFRQSAVDARDELAKRFRNGIWRVVPVELREITDQSVPAVEPQSVDAPA